MNNKVTFGYIYDFRNPQQWRKPWADFYAEALDFIVWTESVGFEGAWVAEHHGDDDGYIPSPLVAVAAIAARTNNIRIGTGVALAPLYHPVRFAEDCALIDILANGRFDLGLGVGYRRRETDAFGIDFAGRGSRTDEFIHLVQRLWAGETVHHEGEYFTVRNATIEPRPLRGRVPMHIGGFSGRALQRAARYGDGYFGQVDAYEPYLKALHEAGKSPETVRFRALEPFLLVSNDPEKALHEIAPHALHMNNAYAHWQAEELQNVDVSSDEVILRPMDLETFKASGQMQVFTPEQAIEYFKDKLTRAPVEHFAMLVPPGFALERFAEYAELFANKVVPAFR